MKKIINPWRNHPEYNCFGCCPDNPIGLHLEFYEDGDYIAEKAKEMGFLPLLDSGIAGYSAEDVVDEENRYVVYSDGGWDWPLWKWG
jgi:hypothetical protein